MDKLFQDLRYGLRMLAKTPGFTAVAVLTLALGIGANAVVFSIVNALFLRPLPVEHSRELVGVVAEGQDSLSISSYSYLSDHNTTFSTLAAHYSTAPIYLVSDQGSQPVEGASVSANYFSVLALQPVLGRFFRPEEDSTPGRGEVVVLSYGLWRGRFSADPAILGKMIKLNGTDFTVIGVAPKVFHGVYASINNDLWIPLSMAQVAMPWCKTADHNCSFVDLIGRLKPGRSMAQSQAEMSGLAKQIKLLYPDSELTNVALFPLRGLRPMDRSDITLLPRLLMAAVTGLLVIACANLAGLLLSRGAARKKEIAVRLALGATQRRVVSQLLVETALLAIAGGVLGFFSAQWSAVLVAKFPFVGSSEAGTSYLELKADPLILLYTAGLSMLTVFLCGLLPAFRTTRPELIPVLKDFEASVTRRMRLRNALVASQVALSLGLLTGGGLLIKSMRNVLAGPGFDPASVAIFRLSPARLGYPAQKSQAIQEEVLRRLAQLPGVKEVSIGRLMPWWQGNRNGVTVDDPRAARSEDKVMASANAIGPGYLRTLGIPLFMGRDFDERDRKGTPNVVIANQTLVGCLWPNVNPVGKILLINGGKYTVIGVAGDAQYHSSSERPQAFFYFNYWQSRDPGDSRIVLRTSGNPAALLPTIERTVHSIDPNVPIMEEAAMPEALLRSFGPLRITTWIAVSSGMIALFLSVLGLYAILSFAVTQRRREIGVRMALGATRSEVLKLVLGQGMKLVLFGALVGGAIAVLFGHLLSSFLYGVRPEDPVTLVVVSLVLVATSLIGSYIPAYRAAKTDPMIALRYE